MFKPTLIEKFSKASRLIRREYKSRAFGAAVGLTGLVAASITIGLGIVSGPGIPFVLLMALYAGAGIAMCGEDPLRVCGRQYELNGFKLVKTLSTQVKKLEIYLENATGHTSMLEKPKFKGISRDA